VEVVASLSQGRTAAAQCGLFTYKSVPVIFEPRCIMMQLKGRNEDSCHIQKYMHIVVTAIVTVLTGRVSCCLFVLSITFTAVKKRNTGKVQF